MPPPPPNKGTPITYAYPVVETATYGVTDSGYEDSEYSGTLAFKTPFDSLRPEVGIIQSFYMFSRYGNESFYLRSDLLHGYPDNHPYVLMKSLFLLFKEFNYTTYIGYTLPDGTSVDLTVNDFEDDALDYEPVDYAHACLARYFTLHESRSGILYSFLAHGDDLIRSIHVGDAWECAFFAEKPVWGSTEDGWYYVEE